MHEFVEPYAEFLGTWRGEGVGGYPSLTGGDFRYGEEITISTDGRPLLAFTSTSWSLDDDRPLARQSGFWRLVSASDVEVVLAVGSGYVEMYYGHRVDGAAGAHVEMATDLVARTASAKEVTAEKRMYAVRGGTLMYAVDMAAMGHPLAPHLSAALERVSG